MSMFVKKPVVISAVQWTGENLMEVIAFTNGKPDIRSTHAGMKWDDYADLVARDGLKIYTLEGKMSANVGDWIIRGVKGECYPRKPDIFTLTYEPVGGLSQGIVAPAPDIGALVVALGDIAGQKKTTEFGYAVSRDEADFEGGYDGCIDRARAALAALKGGKDNG